MPSQPPPRLVLDAFGAAGARPVPLGGGQDTPWLAAGLILKPADLDREELAWQARIYSRLSCDGFRLARPVAAAGGSLCVDGWCASEYIAGRHEQRRWAEIIAVGERFHAALRAISRPGFLDHRASPWAISDRVAWGEYPAGDFPQVRPPPRVGPQPAHPRRPQRQRAIPRPAAARDHRLLALLAARCLRLRDRGR